jgi:hypothetical protein
MIHVGTLAGHNRFLGHRRLPNGGLGPAEAQRAFRNIGDKIISINGVNVSENPLNKRWVS